MTLHIHDYDTGHGAPLSTASLAGEHVPRVTLVGGVTVDSITGTVTTSGSVPESWASTTISGVVLGNNELVAAAAGSRVRVVGLMLSAQGPVVVNLESSVAGPDLAGPITLISGANFVWPIAPRGWWVRTDIGENLNMRLSAAVVVGGVVTYYRE